VLFTDNPPELAVICRTSQAKEPIEWQADYFSGCFLMPRQFVQDAWSRRFGSLDPIVYADIAEQSWAHRPVRKGMKPVSAYLPLCVDRWEPHGYAFETVAREFTPMFRVSIEAMRIRLETLGLLRVDHSPQQDLFAGV
jgi:Zn-dependent peptidase ImmA (M78 family)